MPSASAGGLGALAGAGLAAGVWAKSASDDHTMTAIVHTSTAIAAAIRRLPRPRMAAAELLPVCGHRHAHLSAREICRASFLIGSIGTPYLKNTSLKLEP